MSWQRDALIAIEKLKSNVRELEDERSEPIAVIGMACRLPGGDDPESLWRILDLGLDPIHEPTGPFTSSGGVVDNIDAFDADFFRISLREAMRMDPRQRILLEVSWEALERAGLVPLALEGQPVGVYVGASTHTRGAPPEAGSSAPDAYDITGGLASVLAGRVSYFLGLRGPSMTIDTACSSSLVATHVAIKALRAKECAIALVGGVATRVERTSAAESWEAVGHRSESRRCRTFDAAADGIIGSDGCGVLVLKRLSAALEAGDRVLAVLRGSAVNHDGRSQGLTVPSGVAQEEVIRGALSDARVRPEQVTYVECHGTGTPLGDPIEVHALGQVLGTVAGRERPLLLGSVKSTLGHTDAAAGVVGLLKVILSLEHERVPKQLHFAVGNPQIAWDELNVQVATARAEWPRAAAPRIAGVSSFGISGTNAHVLVAESPTALVAAPGPAAAEDSVELVVLSAKTAPALDEVLARLFAHLKNDPATKVGDVAFSLATGRTHHAYRMAFSVRTRDELIAALGHHTVEGSSAGHADARHAKIVFVFPGQGSQWIGMGRELLAQEPVFREAMGDCDDEIRAQAGWSVLEELARPPERSRLAAVDVVQPTLFAISVALSALWRAWGVEPDAVVGHSMGEVAAAYVAGALSLVDAVKIICRRSTLLARLGGRGAMALVQMTEAEAKVALQGHEGEVSVAVMNSRRSTVLSGDPKVLDAILAKLEARGVFCKRVKVDVASHSPQVDVLRGDLRAALEGVSSRAPTVRMVSTVTGREVGAGDLTPAYWVDNLRQPVRFAAVIEALLEQRHGIFVEASAHPILVPALEEMLGEARVDGAVVPSLVRDRGERHALLDSAGRLHVFGCSLNWASLFRGPRTRVPLPTYPWQRQRCRLEVTSRRAHAGEATGHPLLGVRIPVAGAEAVYDSVLSLSAAAWAYDHRVGERALLPGAAIGELVRAAGEHCFTGDVEVTSLVLQAPLLLPEEGGQRVEVVVSRSEERAEVSVYSQPADSPVGHAWKLHAAGEIKPVRSRRTRMDLEAVRARCGQPVDVEHAYEAFASEGFGYGPAFRGLVSAQLGSTEVLAELSLPSSAEGADRYGIHPVLLDAAFQAAMLVRRAKGVWMPFAIDRFVVHEAGASVALAYASVRAEDSSDGFAADVALLNRRGDVLVEVRGLRARRASPAAVRGDAPGAGPGIAQSFLRLAWPSAPNAEATLPSGRWRIASRAGDPLVDGIHAHLQTLGASCTRVEIAAFDEASAAEVDNLVCLWPPGEHDAEAAIRTASEGLEIVQHLARTSSAGKGPRLLWITRGAVATTPDESADVATAALWGLGRTIAQEHPELRATLIDLDATDDAHPDWMRELGSQDGEDQVAWRKGERRVARLEDARAPRIRPVPAGGRVGWGSGTVLVTGGLGALGSETARWLAARGVERLLLVGRRGLETPGAADTLAELEALGARVTVAAVDVSEREGLAQVLAAIPAEYPLCGVVHAAGVLDDGVILEQTPARFARVMHPKVSAALYLDALTRNANLDFFVLFSSISGVLGSAGQAPYAAANAALDALAMRRRAAGLSAQSLAWGLWKDTEARTVGLASGLATTLAARLERSGLQAVSTAEGMALFEAALGCDEALLVPQPIDLPRLREHLRGAEIPPVWRELVQPPRRTSRAAVESFAHDLERLPAAQRLDRVLEVVRSEVARVLSLPGLHAVAPERPLRELGLDSLMAVEIRNALVRRGGAPLPATLAFDHPTPDAIAALWLDRLLGSEDSVRTASPARSSDAFDAVANEPIAIVGIGCRYPGGITDTEAFWRLIQGDVDVAREIPAERWDIDALYDPDPDAPGKITTRRGGFLADIDRFDAAFFGIAPREAMSLDPQQRLLLETSWEALENAGVVADDLSGSSAGVFIGLMSTEYSRLTGQNLEQMDGYVGTGSAPSVASGRISYVLGLQGPSITVDTACSSSLVAVHLACQALRQGECTMALAGGATLMLAPSMFVEFSRLRGLAADGRCKTFSAEADGVGWSDGCGMLALERLSDALRNGRRILGVIRGSAVNQDGRSNGLTAPNGPAQQAVVRRALKQAGLRPRDLHYVECHGTGTRLGDPIEVQALGEVLGEGRDPTHPVVIGSVKSHIGHTQAAAGVAGIIKVVLSMQHELIPKQLNFRTPNPHIAWEELPVRVAAETERWPRNGVPRRAGVSSFGISGTNAHVVIEEPPGAPRRPDATPVRTAELVVLSARTPAALDEAADRIHAHVTERPELSLGDLAFSLGTTRAHHPYRRAFVAHTREEVATALTRPSAPSRAEGGLPEEPSERGKLVWLFAGTGSHIAGLGRELFEAWPAFRTAFDEVVAALEPHLGAPLRDAMWAEPGTPKARELHEVATAQPALFALEVALAALWRSWGIEPDVVAGHGVGEVTAAYVAGILALEDAARLVAARGRFMQALPRGGAMVSVAATEAEVMGALAEVLATTGRGADAASLAAVNGHRSVVLSGDEDVVTAVAQRFEGQGVMAKRLDASHAFHSSRMDPMLNAYREVAASMTYRPARLPMVSLVSGMLSEGEILSPTYWVRQARETIRFADGVRTLWDAGATVFLELGPGSILLEMIPGCLPADAKPDLVATLRSDQSGLESVLVALGTVYVRGARIAWRGVFPGERTRVPLPTYAWQRQRYWPEARAEASSEVVEQSGRTRGRSGVSVLKTAHDAPLAPFLLSARDDAALRAQADRWANRLSERPETEWPLLLRAAALHRTHLDARAAIAVAEPAPAIAALRALAQGRPHNDVLIAQARPLGGTVFVFPGQGGQWPAMGRALLEQSAAFKDAVAACDAALFPHTGWSVEAVLRGEETEDLPPRDRVDVVQPALFTMAIALAATWASLGVRPDAVVGTSQGEVAAAVVAGALSLADGAAIVAGRAQLLVPLAGTGALAAVELPLDDLQHRLRDEHPHLCIAGVNAPQSALVAGDPTAIDGFIDSVAHGGIFAKRVDIDYASHSPHMDALLPALARMLRSVRPRKSEVPLFSTVYGKRIHGEEMDAGYWCRNLREAGRLDLATAALLEDHKNVFIEVSPHPVLALALHAATETTGVVVGSLTRGKGGLSSLFRSLGLLHVNGFGVDWKRFWHEGAPTADVARAGLSASDHPFLCAKALLAETGDVIFSGRLAIEDAPWLTDHKVFDSILFPGTGILEMALAAGADLGCPLVAELALAAPLVLQELPVQLQLHVRGPDEGGRRTFSLHGRPDAADARWTRHATGTLGPESAELAQASWGNENLAAWPPPGAVPVPLSADFYPRIEERGLAYGPAFRGLAAVFRHGDVLFADVSLPDAAGDDAFALHPALLDAALHALATSASQNDDVGTSTVRLPFAWTNAKLSATHARALRVRLVPQTSDSFALFVCDARGGPLARAELHLRAASVSRIEAAAGRQGRDLYRVLWHNITLQDGDPPLRDAFVLGGSAWAEPLGIPSLEDIGALRARLDGGLPPPEHLFFDLAATPPDLDLVDVAEIAQHLTAGALDVLQFVLAEPRLADTACVWVTRGAVATGPDDHVPSLVHAAIVGLLRTARSEHLGRRLRLVDLDDAPPSLPLLFADQEPELALRHSAVLAPRLVDESAGPRHLEPPPDAHAWRLHLSARGHLENVSTSEVPSAVEPLPEGHVRVDVRAAGLNFRDVLNTLGLVPAPTLGLELAGVVTHVAPDVSSLAVGDRVMGLGQATFATSTVVDARFLTTIPRGLSFLDAATIPLAFLTALYGLRDIAGLEPGQRVLVHAAAGGVGMAAIQIARLRGADVFATASPRKWPALRELGVPDDHIGSSRDDSFERAFSTATQGEGVHVVLNSLTGDLVDASLRLLPRGGHFAEMGRTDLRSHEEVARRYPGVRYQPFDLIEAGPHRIQLLLRELAELLVEGRIRPLPRAVYDLKLATDAFRTLAQARHVGKIVLKPQRPFDVRGTFLITGALGELGRALARHLVERHGARNLLLLSRRGADDPAARDLVNDLLRHGASDVRVVAVDVSVRSELDEVLRGIPPSQPLTAVFHLAAVLHDALLADLSHHDLLEVLRPKVQGAWNLHLLTKHEDLDAFVLFSSTSALLGGPGQANYAAANAFLDALAAHRRYQGLHALSLAWGLWQPQGVGLTAHLSETDLQRVRNAGVAPLSFDHAFELFDRALTAPDSALVPVRLDLERLQHVYEDRPALPIFQKLIRPPLRQADDAALPLDLRARLAPLSHQQRLEHLAGFVRRIAATVLGFPDDAAIPLDKPLKSLGLDSLAAVEIKHQLVAAAKLPLPTTLLFDHPTLRALAKRLAESMQLEAAPTWDDAAVRDKLRRVSIGALQNAALLKAFMDLPDDEAAPTPHDDNIEDLDGDGALEVLGALLNNHPRRPSPACRTRRPK